MHDSISETVYLLKVFWIQLAVQAHAGLDRRGGILGSLENKEKASTWGAWWEEVY